MRELIMQVTCDLCKKTTGDEDSVQPLQIQDASGSAVEVDICLECREVKMLKTTLGKLLAAGVSVQPKKRSTRSQTKDTTCPECKKMFTHRGLSLHRAKSHGIPVSDQK